jgi:outer membrane protein assembly factor BamB
VYACFQDGSFAALDFSGRIVWINRDYPYYSQHGLATSLICYRDMLIMTRDGSSETGDKRVGWQIPWDKSYILALDAATGRERWKAYRGMTRIAHGVPNIWEDKSGVQLVSEVGDVVQGFDIQTGRLLWTSTVIGEGKVPSVVLGDGLVFTAGGFGGRESIKAFRLGGKGDLGESNLVWEQRKGTPKVPSMIYLRPYLYAITDSGIASCIQGETGEIVWQERLGGNYSASPVSAEGRIYFLSDDGETVVMQAGPTPKVLARNPLGEKTQASMAISQGQIFIRTVRNLYCIGATEDASRNQ